MRTFKALQDEYHALCHMVVESCREEIARDAARMALEWAQGDNIHPMSEMIKRDLFFGKLEEKDWNVTETKRT